MMHAPVLLQEVIQFLEPKPGDFMIDGTTDGGGHAAAILKRILPNGKLLAVDWDEKMLHEFTAHTGSSKSVICAAGNYADLPSILEQKRLGRADGLLLDLGFSSEQLESSGRGFSFKEDEPLCMTYDIRQRPLKDVLQKMDEETLTRVIRELSNEKFAKQIAHTIVMQEKIRPIETTRELRDLVIQSVPKNYEHGRIAPPTRTFQALRMYVNNELGNLEKVLKNLALILASGGRIAIITFHSLEDRLVKHYFRDMEKKNQLTVLTKKPVMPSPEEIRANPRSRSAKLRAAIVT